MNEYNVVTEEGWKESLLNINAALLVENELHLCLLNS